MVAHIAAKLHNAAAASRCRFANRNAPIARWRCLARSYESSGFLLRLRSTHGLARTLLHERHNGDIVIRRFSDMDSNSREISEKDDEEREFVHKRSFIYIEYPPFSVCQDIVIFIIYQPRRDI